MGQSTDAILVWGFDLGSEEDFPEALADRIEFLQEEGYDDLKALEEKTGVELISHCSNDVTHYIIGVSATKTRAHRGRPKEVYSLEHPILEDQAAIDAFCKELGAKSDKGRWLLASYWG